MILKLFLAFTLIPVIEIYLLMQISAILGPLSAIILVVATGFAGANLAKIQGAQTMIRVRENLKQGIMPGDEVIDAFLILVAGIVLITPGLLTDIAGILLLIPVTRQRAKEYLKREFSARFRNGSIRINKF
ncbi:MAG: FxsA family protein [Proteobacteria bacterium]|nr:FxsA family protein [Pseudomonadota bacterium]